MQHAILGAILNPVRRALAICIVLVPGYALAVPVTGWIAIDASTGNASSKPLAAANTNAPVIGDGTNGSATQMAIYADIAGQRDAAPDVALANGQQITLTGSANLAGIASSMEQFRWGLFYEGAAPFDAKGWLGYIGNNSAGSSGGALRAKNGAFADFNNNVFISTSTSGSAVNLQTDQDGGSFTSGVYDFSMTIGRYGDELSIDAALSRGTDFSQVWTGAAVTASNLLTFNFNRVGFLSGNSMSADRISFSDIDVSTSPVESLTLRVAVAGPDAGATQLVNRSGVPLDIEYYEITSAAGVLNPAGWLSLHDQQSLGPPLAGWNEAGGVDAGILAEANILQSMIVPAATTINLGNAFTPGTARDLRFNVGLASGKLLRGVVEYVVPGDFNHDNVVSPADLGVWRAAYGATAAADASGDGVSDGADFLIWQRNLGASAATAAAAAVPEPAAALLAAVGFAACRWGVKCSSRRPAG
jgi:hypothetical protein